MYMKRNQSPKEKKAFVQFFEFFHSGGLFHPIWISLIRKAKMVKYDRFHLPENSIIIVAFNVTPTAIYDLPPPPVAYHRRP